MDAPGWTWEDGAWRDVSLGGEEFERVAQADGHRLVCRVSYKPAPKRAQLWIYEIHDGSRFLVMGSADSQADGERRVARWLEEFVSGRTDEWTGG